MVENLATRNGEAGIAITGAVEDVKLTRNRTRLNGGPAQCVGTACS